MLSTQKTTETAPDIKKDLNLLKLIKGTPTNSSQGNSTQWLDELCRALLGESR